MTFHPAPVDPVTPFCYQNVQTLPKFDVFHRLFGCCSPATHLPAVNPLGDAFANVFAVQIEDDGAWALECCERFNNSGQFHSIVRRSELSAKQFPFASAGTQDGAPPARARIAFACAIGVDHDIVQSMLSNSIYLAASLPRSSIRVLRFATETGAPTGAVAFLKPGSISRAPATCLTATAK